MPSRSKSISNTIGSTIRQLREEKCWTQKELAQKIHKSESAIRMWELKKSEPDIQTITELSKLFCVSTDFLTGNQTNYLPKKGIKIPVFGSVAAGIPIEAITDIEDYEEISEEMASKGNYFALRIKGTSMEPDIKDGSIVIVRQQNYIEDGRVAIVLVNGDDATCKRIRKTPDGILLISNNPSFKPMFYTNQEIDNLPVRIIGQVEECRTKIL